MNISSIKQGFEKVANFEQKKIALLCALLAALQFFPSLFFDFTYDDFHQIHNHTLVVSQEVSLDTLIFPFFEPTFPGDLYRPLTILSYRITHILFGLKPFWFHLINLLLHSGVTAFVFLLAAKITKNTPLALFSAAWFALHPIHVEAVASIVGRAELLAAFFGLTALFSFNKTVGLDKSTERIGWLLTACFAYLASLMSKESAITLLPLIPIASLLMLDITKHGFESRKKKALTTSTALLAAAVFYLFLRKTILSDLFAPISNHGIFWVENPLLETSLIDRIIPGFVLLGQYTALLLFPIRLTADYSSTFDNYWASVFSSSGVVSLLAASLFIFAVYRLRDRKFVFFGIWTLVTISIALNIVFPIGTIYAERLAYLPSIGFCIFIPFAFAYLAQKIKLSKKLVLIIAGLILAFSLFRSLIRLPVWENNETLFLTTLADSPKSPKTKINLGLHRYNQKRYPESSQLFTAAVLDDPERIFPYPYLINSLLFQGRIDEAEMWCKKALQIEPNNQQIAEALRRILRYKQDLGFAGDSAENSS